MPIELALARRGRRCSRAVAVLLLLSLAGATAASPSTTAALSLDDASAASRRWSSSSSWWQGRAGHSARRLLLAVQPDSTATVGKDTNEFNVGRVRRPANGKLAGEVAFDAGRRIPDRDANHRHN